MQNLQRRYHINQCLSVEESVEFNDSNNAICSAMESLRRRQHAEFRQSLHRSSEHHWQQEQSGQGCFFGDSSGINRQHFARLR